MRRIGPLFAALAPLALGLGACADRHRGLGDDNAIVFGLSQSVDPATGRAITHAGYEYLALAHRGGWAPATHAEGDDVCIVEDLARRPGRLHVGDGGQARFRGGALPPEGVLVVANEDERTYEGAAWDPARPLAFEIERGFALPEIGTIALDAPRVELGVLAPPPGPLDLDASLDFGIAWSPSGDPRASSVLVSLETETEDGPRKQVRCFFDDDDGQGIVPARFLRELGAPTTTGKLRVASHRQVTVLAPGAWVVYVVGAVLHREQPFTTR